MLDIKIEITQLIQPLIDSIETITNEGKDLLNIGVSSYLENQAEKHLYTNTFVHRFEKVNFFSIYHQLIIRNKSEIYTFNSPVQDFGKNKYFTILGNAGSGKSTLIKYIFLNCIKSKYKIPIILELRYLNSTNKTLKDYIYSKLLINKIKNSQSTLERGLRKGQFVILLDGYDEIYIARKGDISSQIDEFIDEFSKCDYIITSRPGSGVESFPRFNNYKVNKLTKNDIISFINRLVEDQERKNRILKETKLLTAKKNNVSTYSHYLSNPLLLSMFILTFGNHPEIPNKKNIFYRNVFDTLYSKHDGITKISFKREKKTVLGRSDFEKILEAFCYLTYYKGELVFTNEVLEDRLIKVRDKLDLMFIEQDVVYDLRTSIGILILDGFEFTFPHRSMQEYFCALFISKLSTNQKEFAYNKYLEVLKSKFTDSGYNFWELAEELDHIGFNNFFVLKLLKFIKESISVSPSILAFKNISKLFNIRLHYSSILEKYDYSIRVFETIEGKEKIIRENLFKNIPNLSLDSVKIKDNQHKKLYTKNVYKIDFYYDQTNLYYRLIHFLSLPVSKIFEIINSSEDDAIGKSKYDIGKALGLKYDNWHTEKILIDEIDKKIEKLISNSVLQSLVLDTFKKNIEEKIKSISSKINRDTKFLDELLDLE